MNKNEFAVKRSRENERGAALVMVLIISTLLLIVGGALLVSASMNTANVTDSLSEEQAYYAAESGIQTALNVLRGNSTANYAANFNQEFNSNPNLAGFVVENAAYNPDAQYYYAAATPTPTPAKITYRQAVNKATSNSDSDNSTEARLSRWIKYKYVNGVADRVIIGGSDNLGFRLNIENPVATSNNIVFSTSGAINNGSSGSYQIGSGGNTVTITYNPRPDTNLDVSSGSAQTDIGSFTVAVGGTGATWSQDVRFSISFKMSAPNSGNRMIRGWIKSAAGLNAKIDQAGKLTFVFDTTLWELTGSRVTLTSQTYLPLPLLGTSGTATVNANVTPPELQKIVIRSTGFGPRGAQKQLEAFVRKDLMNGLYAPSTITMVGKKDNFVFNEGTSNVTTYSGDDAASSLMIPPIGVAVPGLDVNAFRNSINKVNVVGEPGDVTDELPDWLQSTQNLDTTINNLRLIAQSSGRYFPAGVTPDNFGSTTGKGITFADGNVSLAGDGGGILICTGTLTLNGNFNFKGMIIVTGSGGVQRNGGGGGKLLGNMVIAPYNASNLAAGLLSPKYDLNGGGNSTIQFDSSSVFNGLEAIDNIIVGLAEK